MKITSIDPPSLDHRDVLAALNFLAAGFEEICHRSRPAKDIIFEGTLDDILHGMPAIEDRKRAAFDELTVLCDQRFGSHATNQALAECGTDHWQRLGVKTANVSARVAAAS
jgi:hypothetical protein